jgi:hypothetical protein
MLRRYPLAAALLSLTISAGAAEQGKTSSWSSERMRLKAPPKAPPFTDELAGNCPGLTVMIKARIERLKALQEKASREQWPPLSITAQWAKRPLDGDIARQNQKIARLNAALGTKGCQTVDVGLEQGRAPAVGVKAKTK